MKKHFSRAGLLLIILGLLFLSIAVISQTAFAPVNEEKAGNTVVRTEPTVSNITTFDLADAEVANVGAASFLVLDFSTDQILFGKQVDNSLPIASLTKLMTVWTVLQHSRSDEVVTVSNEHTLNISPSLNLVAGDKVKVGDLIQAILVGSANDAASVLGGHISAKLDLPFGELMNQEAVELGMKNSRFSNPMGFDSVVNYSSARDLTILVHKLYNEQLLKQSLSAQSYSFRSELGKDYSISATNKLTAQYPDLKAIKTGYTELAQGAMINLLEKGDKQWLIVVIGSPDRETDTLQLRKEILSR